MQNLYGAQTILHSKSLCYSTPPERGHLSRTGHIGGYYMLVYTVGGDIRDNTAELLKECGDIGDSTAELVQLYRVLFSYYCPCIQLCVEGYCHPGVYITALYSAL